MMKPIIGITMGDAAGVGPEIIAKAFAHETIFETGRPFVIGDVALIERAVDITKTELNVVGVSDVSECVFEPGTIEVLDLRLLTNTLPFGKVSEEAGNAAFRYVERAVELAKDKKINAICTAPLNKEAMQKAGHMYPGHTEILAELTDTTDFSMMLSAPNLKVIHLTTHVGLRKAIDMINPDRTHKVISLADETLKNAGNANPRIAVCGINLMPARTACSVRARKKKNLFQRSNKPKKKALMSKVLTQRIRCFSAPHEGILISLLHVTTTKDMFLLK